MILSLCITETYECHIPCSCSVVFRLGSDCSEKKCSETVWSSEFKENIKRTWPMFHVCTFRTVDTTDIVLTLTNHHPQISGNNREALNFQQRIIWKWQIKENNKKKQVLTLGICTSAVGQGEIPGRRARWGGEAGQRGVALQHVARAAAEADLVADVEGGPLLLAVEQLPGVATCVARQSCGKRERDGRRGWTRQFVVQICDVGARKKGTEQQQIWW